MFIKSFLIQMDYHSVMNVVRDMKDERDKYKKEINKLRAIYSDLKANWEGPAARKYLERLRDLINNMSINYREMDKVIKEISSTAKSIKEKDEKNASMVDLLKKL